MEANQHFRCADLDIGRHIDEITNVVDGVEPGLFAAVGK